MTKLPVFSKSFSRENLEQLLEQDKKFTAIEIKRHHKRHLVFLDTFDWRLWNSGYCFIKENREYTLLSRKDGSLIVKTVTPGPMEFIGDIPQGQLKELLGPILFVRKLLPFTEMTLQEGELVFLNKDEKTVLRGVFQDMGLTSPEHFNLLRVQLQPLQGYGKEQKKGEKIFLGMGFTPTQEKSLSLTSLPEEIRSHYRRKPGKYKGKVSIDFRADEKIIHGALRILSKLVSVIKENHRGVIEDIDSEFLHDFRVGMRRTRSFISQVKRIFSKNTENELKSFLKRIGRFSGPVRDLDVYLLNKDHFLSCVDQSHQEGVNNLFTFLKEIRDHRWKKLAGFLQSPEYYGGIKKYEDLLFNPAKNLLGPQGDKKIGKAASKSIYKQYLKILNYFDQDDRSEHRIHEIRILCKKLRYLLEFFTSLYPKKTIKQITTALKKLQDQLGIFNDRHIQREMIKGYLYNPSHPLLEMETTKEALRYLLVTIEQTGKTMRHDIESALSNFCDKKTQNCFRELFETSF